MSYQPIENYGIIGNMRTVALVGMNSSVDWYCYPLDGGGVVLKRTTARCFLSGTDEVDRLISGCLGDGRHNRQYQNDAPLSSRTAPEICGLS
jgi:hypothetical protein